MKSVSVFFLLFYFNCYSSIQYCLLTLQSIDRNLLFSHLWGLVCSICFSIFFIHSLVHIDCTNNKLPMCFFFWYLLLFILLSLFSMAIRHLGADVSHTSSSTIYRACETTDRRTNQVCMVLIMYGSCMKLSENHGGIKQRMNAAKNNCQRFQRIY